MKNNIIFIRPRELIFHERVNFRRAVWILLKMVLSGYFDAPILVDSRTKTILDGHHRCYAANRLGLYKVPCYMLDYFKDESIKVWTRRPEIFVDKEEVIRMALSEGVFPHKTTRHEYKTPGFDRFPLNELQKE